jgi:hypothetical protein
MAIVHVRLDVDSDVHPELYAMLVAIDRAASRAERMRQLASGGLIWEHLRVQGPVLARVDIEVGTDQVVERALVVAPPPVVPPPAAPPPAASAPTPPPAPVATPLAAPAPVPRPPPARLAPQPVATEADDAATPAKRAPRPRAGPSRNLPVLYDSVELGEVEGRQRAAAEENTTESRETSADGAPPPPQKTGPRPRLMRMKEKGLFNNG